LIARYFAPLAAGAPGAMALTDDACVLTFDGREDLVLTADALVGDVHFLSSDPPDRIGRKLLRVNLSDLAGKGARPVGYLMTLALNESVDEPWIAAFCDGLASDQAQFGVTLLGGDTVLTPGPLSLSVTALGVAEKGAALRRKGAAPGDRILATGSIGDGHLGLCALRGDFPDLAAGHRRHLVDRYQLPEPRVAFGAALGRARLGQAGMDISDGLLGDLAHICAASSCGAVVEAHRLPVSPAASEILALEPDRLPELMTCGDDYELLFAVSPAKVTRVQALASESGTQISDIGHFVAGRGVSVIDRVGAPIDVAIGGFTHF
jgi:thiamine-monophosphate kinase